jgi:P27 family predicted phage terminase small subunit
MPNERKRRIGNPGKRALPELAAVTPLPALSNDTPVSLGPYGAELWESITATAKAWLAPSDHPMLMLLCELADRRETFRKSLIEHGTLIERPGDGHLVANPAAAMLSDVEKRMVHIASLMGLTAADRTRIGLGEVKAKNAFEEMLSKRREREG